MRAFAEARAHTGMGTPADRWGRVGHCARHTDALPEHTDTFPEHTGALPEHVDAPLEHTDAASDKSF